MYAYIMTLPDNWEIQKRELYKHFAEGRDYLDKGFNELKEYGYIDQKRIKKENGQFLGWQYVVYEFAQKSLDETTNEKSIISANPSKELPILENPHSVNSLLLKTDRKQKTKKETKKTNKKEIVENDAVYEEQNQLVSSSSPFFVQDDKSTHSSQEDEVKEDLESIGLSRSQITALFRVHPMAILENAVTETIKLNMSRE